MSVTFDVARRLILEQITPLPAEELPLLEAVGRALAEDIHADAPMPRFNNSAMDGFALRSADAVPGASLPVAGYVPAGAKGLHPVLPGTAVRIMTGAPVPPGADSVVPFEEVEESNGRIRILSLVSPADHIRFRGEDISPGCLILAAGSPLRPAEISLLASMNRTRVTVVRPPRIAILSTGDELAELGSTLQDEQIVNSNSWALAAAVIEAGAEPVILGIARDTEESLREKLTEGIGYDALITSAGVSMGDRDLVRIILDEIGVKQIFWKVNIKPGRPTAFGVCHGVPVFSLPGNPVSAMITFEEFVRPAILKMMGHRQIFRPMVKAVLTEQVKKKAGRTHFMRVCVTEDQGGLRASSSGDQNTGILSTMLRANGIAILPADRDLIEAGEEVQLHLLESAV